MSAQRDPPEPGMAAASSHAIVAGAAVAPVANIVGVVGKTIGDTGIAAAVLEVETAWTVVVLVNTEDVAARMAGHIGAVAAEWAAESVVVVDVVAAAAVFVAETADRAGIACVAAAVPQSGVAGA